MPIWLTVQRHSGVRIDLQIVEQIKHALEVGVLRPGDPLPGVRDLARDLALAPNTIGKAYEELQRLGLIESRPRAGTTVAEHVAGALHGEQVAALFARLDTLVRDAAGLSVAPGVLRARFEAAVAVVYGPEQAGRMAVPVPLTRADGHEEAVG